ncbi:hypothetical protein [Streptomyces cyaneofuscatus]|uniref:hypothetical protein n=1 Tax=Streptomyces cyaneofuscatus TaxID=66883 RepID=UPI003665F42C
MSVLVCSELRDDGLADPKSSLQETRAGAYYAGKRASDAVSAVTELRREIGEVLALLPARVPGEVDAEGDESTTAEPEPLSGQRHVQGEELAPEGADAPAAAEVLAEMETAEEPFLDRRDCSGGCTPHAGGRARG